MKKCILFLGILSAFSLPTAASHPARDALIFGTVSTVAAAVIVTGIPYLTERIKTFAARTSAAAPETEEWAGPLPVEIEQLCDFQKRHSYYRKFNLKPGHGYLFYGPPGTGKTLLAETVAKKLKIPLVRDVSGNFLSRWQGSGTTHLQELLERAHRCPQPKRGYFKCVLFIDEIDGICCREEQFNREELRLAEQLLADITDPRNEHILFIGATNLIKSVDPAFLRPGRLTALFVGHPNKEMRQALFAACFKKHKLPLEQLDPSSYARKTHGFSCAAIRQAVEQALYHHLKNPPQAYAAYLDQALEPYSEDIL